MKVLRALFSRKILPLLSNEDFPAWVSCPFFSATRAPLVYRLPFMALNVQN